MSAQQIIQNEIACFKSNQMLNQTTFMVATGCWTVRESSSEWDSKLVNDDDSYCNILPILHWLPSLWMMTILSATFYRFSTQFSPWWRPPPVHQRYTRPQSRSRPARQIINIMCNFNILVKRYGPSELDLIRKKWLKNPYRCIHCFLQN